ncbi:MAG: ribonuclease catalytic domain-containing protein [Desulfobacterales bacterium]
MEPGQIVDYIDRQKILSAVVLENKKQKLHLLNESNREVSLSPGRILTAGEKRVDTAMPRDGLVDLLKDTARRRAGLADQVNVKELWELLHEEKEWLSAELVADLWFPDDDDNDYEAAVIRAFFQNRLYFKFDQNRFFPYTEEQVEQLSAQKKGEDRKRRIIDEGGQWLKRVSGRQKPADEDFCDDLLEIIKSLYLYEKDSPHYAIGKEMLKRAGISAYEDLFPILVMFNIFDENENIELLRMEIPVDFPKPVVNAARHISRYADPDRLKESRKDLTDHEIVTIDGPETRDFDDAVSLERDGDFFWVGIHISDVAHYVKKGDPVDEEAMNRGSSIYMPDRKIPMIPAVLSEEVCSLLIDSPRPAISVLVKLTAAAKIIEYNVVPSIIQVKRQMTYADVDAMASENEKIACLVEIASKFRQQRLMQGAVHISLPETQLWLDDRGELHFQRIDRESPGRMLIAEMMIMANWLQAKYLSEKAMPAVYRTQQQPKERLYKNEEGSLFQNYMQRRLLSRFKLSDMPESHSGLGLDAYVTATSPIRKYYDLVTQRQLRAVFGLETPYGSDEINRMIQILEVRLQQVFRIQQSRNRYWTLKHLEGKIGEKHQAFVLMKRKNSRQVLLPEFMIEAEISVPGGVKLKPGDVIDVKIQHVDAKKNLFSLFLC